MRCYPERLLLASCTIALLVFRGVIANAQQFTLSTQVEIYADNEESKQKDDSGVVVWLEPMDSASKAGSVASESALPKHYLLTQRDHAFAPHTLVVPVGSVIEVPNRDLVFHNAFSLFEGKRFDLGLYEAGTSRSLHIDKTGVSYVFCNIHYEMSAVIIALDTPYYGISNHDGSVNISGIPTGRYELRVWAEGASPEVLDQLTQEISMDRDWTIETMKLRTVPAIKVTHQNKYGHNYDPLASKSPYDSRTRQ